MEDSPPRLGKKKKRKEKKKRRKGALDSPIISKRNENFGDILKAFPMRKVDESFCAVLSNMMTFCSSSSTFVNFLLLCKETYNHFTNVDVSCSKHIHFSLSRKPPKHVKLKYVRIVFIVKEYIVFKRFKFFKYFPNLEKLEVKHQFFFSGKELKYLKQLTSLRIKWCDSFKGTELAESKKKSHNTIFKKLKVLEVCENDQIKDSFFQKFESLEELKLIKCNQISNLAITPLKSLKKLKITHCNQIDDEGLCEMKLLEVLHLKWCNRITGTKIGHNLTFLKVLNLWNMDSITDEVFSSSFDHLEKLGIRFCHLITGKDLPVGFFSKLKELNLIHCDQIQDSFIQSCSSSSLEALEVKKCRQITDASFKNLDHLIFLKIWGLVSVTDKMFEDLTSLEILRVEFCRQINGSGFIHLKQLKNLEIKEGFASNTLRFFCNLTDHSFQEDFCQQIHSLKLDCTQKITGSGFIHFKNLKKIQLVDLNELTDEAFANLPNIKEIEMKRCKKITGETLFDLKDLCVVKIKSCKGIGKDVLKKLKKDIKRRRKFLKRKKSMILSPVNFDFHRNNGI